MDELKPKPRAKRRKLTFSQYYNASQLRADTWNRLKHDALRLAEAEVRERDVERLRESIGEALDLLEPVESYWVFPGRDAIAGLRRLLEAEDYRNLGSLAGRIVRALSSDAYRRRAVSLRTSQEAAESESEIEAAEQLGEESAHGRPYFEVLVVDTMGPLQEASLKLGMRQARRPDDPFIYELLVLQSVEDALIAVLTNFNIQTVVIRFSFPYRSVHQIPMLQRELFGVDQAAFEAISPADRGILLCEVIGRLRPELCVYIVTDVSIEEMAGRTPPNCLRVFYQQEDFLELHLNILRGVNARYQTPFFTALKEYSRQPTGVFHAMPISRGKSITKSHWIQDMGQFYGMNIFLAETSATSGGLDSLLEPTGPIKKAQQLAARAFGSQRTYFVTNGTSTANKIVLQALGRARRHPPGRPRLPQVAPLRAGAFGRSRRLSRQLSAASVLDVRGGAVARDQETAARVPCRRQARPGQGAAAHQLHLRRHRLQRAPGDGGVPGDQAGPGLLLGRGLVRLRPLRRHLPPAHRHGDRGRAAPEVSQREVP